MKKTWKPFFTWLLLSMIFIPTENKLKQHIHFTTGSQRQLFLSCKFHKVHMKDEICVWQQKGHLVWGSIFWDNDVSEFWPSHGFIWGRQVFSQCYVVVPFAVTSHYSQAPESSVCQSPDELQVELSRWPQNSTSPLNEHSFTKWC